RHGWAGIFGDGWSRFIPVEEVLFYFFCFAAILLTYMWCDEVLFGTHKVDPQQRTPAVFAGWMRTVLFWALVGAVLFGIALIIRAAKPSESGHAFPGYFLFLLLTSILPSMICSR